MKRADWRSVALARSRRPWLAPLVLAAAMATAAAADLPRHPLETHALVEPERVIAELPPLIDAAQKRGDLHELALLQLARANACRVIADWDCQRDAGSRAHDAATAAGDVVLNIRSLLADARASIALQDFSRGEHLLGQAQQQLQVAPNTTLEADVFLAYSSLSYSLGKHALAIDYAERGLALDADVGAATRVRLLRNRARAEAQLGRTDAAQRTLALAHQLYGDLDDPKLRAELFLETARVARSKGDVETQLRSGQAMLELADRLKNAQVAGQAHEVLGVAAGMTDTDTAASELRLALEAFRRLNQGREELRVLRELIPVEIHRHATRSELELLTLREIELSRSLEETDRAKSAADFEARVKYAQSEIELARLKQEAVIADERAAAMAHTSRLTNALIALAGIMLVVLATFFLLQWRAKQRLQLAYDRYRESERRYRMLADNSRDLVVRMRADGHRLYVSPSARELLGLDPEELTEPRWELVHPDDRVPLREAIAALVAAGGTATVTYRARHRDGHYVWIEALAQRVVAADAGSGVEIVYSGRDITARVQAEQALAESQRRLLAVTDNIPALIAQFDADLRYRFANDYHRKAFGLAPADLIGMHLADAGSGTAYSVVRGHAEAALRGEAGRFEGEIELHGRHYHFQSHYVPDRGEDGGVRGFYALTFDITALKQAEQALERLARFDSMTGVANRRHFQERLELALARARRSERPLALFYLDIDHFKRINDSLGHGVGDEVIIEFARRLVANVRQQDMVARLGGDEFVILVEDVLQHADAEAVAAKLVVAMHDDVLTSAGRIRITTSVGVAVSSGLVDPITLIAVADQALYSAKGSGRDTYRLRTARPAGEEPVVV
ncbi:diguanylate cyclase domain-containing protein [Tahibacter sp. UC22_41]|uniref:diguanylate cyclase domain-containing protein n=1 Tax=Tahibacter sp. UC22_41 TaxID=3350178 RepID=UPI0036D811AF